MTVMNCNTLSDYTQDLIDTKDLTVVYHITSAVHKSLAIQKTRVTHTTYQRCVISHWRCTRLNSDVSYRIGDTQVLSDAHDWIYSDV